MVSPYKIGIAPINWSNDDDPSLGGDISFEQCIQEMAETGYQGCEIGNKFPRDVDELNTHLKPLHLEISSAWFSSMLTVEGQFEETLSRFLHHLSFLNNLGAKFVTIAECGQAIHGSSKGLFQQQSIRLSSMQWNALIQGLHIMGRLCHDYGMKLVYHHHLGTVIEQEVHLHQLMESTCPDLVGLLLDTGHAYASGMCPIRLLKEYSSRVDYIHLKDVRNVILSKAQQSNWSFLNAVKAGLFTVPGDGNINFEGIFTQIKENAYRGWLIVEAEQDPNMANPKDYAVKARKFIKQQIGA